MQRNRAGPKFENSYQKLNVPRELQQHSTSSHDHAAKAAGKNISKITENSKLHERGPLKEAPRGQTSQETPMTLPMT